MKITRALVALFVGVGLFVAPLTPANAAVVCPENGGGAFTLTLNEAPTPAGTVGVAYNQVITTNAGIALQVIGGTVAPGVNATETGAALDQILISGTPTTAGSFNASIQIVSATQTVTCSWAFVVNGGAGGGGGGGGGVIEQPLTVGDPVKGGNFVENNRITCASSTFSLTPSRIRIFFTKNGVEIPDDAGNNVTSVDVPSSPDVASLLLTEDLVDSAIGCTVYAKSGTSEKTSSVTWGTLVAVPTVTRILEISEDALRNGGTSIFDNPSAAELIADGFVGGRFQIAGKSLNSFTFTLIKADGRTPGQTPLSSEKAVTVLSQTPSKAMIQFPEVSALGAYYLVGRTSSNVISIPISILKPILTIPNAKALVSKNRYLLEGDKVYGNTYTTLSDVAVLNPTVNIAFKKEFPKGFKVSFIKNSEFLTDATTAALKKLAKLTLTEVVVTGFGFKGGTQKVNRELATTRAEAIAKVLASAGLKNARVVIQIDQFDRKYSRQAEVSIR